MVFNSPAPGVPQTAAKANMGALVSAGVTMVLYILARWTGVVEMPAATLVQDAVFSLVSAAVMAIATRVVVYMTPNKPLVLVLATCVAATLLLGGLTACAPAGTNAGQTPLQQHIATAEIYVGLAIDFADGCVRQKLPLCVGHEAEIAQAKAVAVEALAEAKRQAAEGAGADLVQTTLRVAMSALLLFYPSKV